MWDHKKSLRLSQVVTVVAGLAVLAVLLYGPWLVNWLIGISNNASEDLFWLFIATLYIGGIFAIGMLVCLFMLLQNISKGNVFVQANVRLARYLSWFCFIGAGIALASTIYYLPWGIVALAAAFVGLIVRVVKNILAEAIVLKEENDLTV